MDLLECLKVSLLNSNFVMIYMIHRIKILIKSILITFKIVFSNAFLRIIIDF